MASPAVSNRVIFFGCSDMNLYAIDAVTGTEKWRFVMTEYINSMLAVSKGVVYFGSNDGYLYAVGGVPTSQVNTQTTSPTQTVATNTTANWVEFFQIWDRNNLTSVVLLVFVLLFGALVYDTYYKKKK